MAAKSTNTPATSKARSRRKTNSATTSSTIYPLSSYEIKHRASARATKELMDFYSALSEAEKLVVGHVKPFGDPARGWQEIRRLLGESIAKCKVIPFPVVNKRLEAKEAQ